MHKKIRGFPFHVGTASRRKAVGIYFLLILTGGMLKYLHNKFQMDRVRFSDPEMGVQRKDFKRASPGFSRYF